MKNIFCKNIFYIFCADTHHDVKTLKVDEKIKKKKKKKLEYLKKRT